MISTEKFVQKLLESNIHFFTGVPDSLLKDFGNYIYSHISANNHVIVANEGNAIALAAGSYLASNTIPLVYLQNAGLGNIVNPLLSMADASLYAIPMIILVGWRGKDGKDDAEQHLQQGSCTPSLIEAMQYPFCVLSQQEETALQQIDKAIRSITETPQPYFLIVEKETFSSVPLTKKVASASNMSREKALHIVARSLPEDYFVVTTTGKTSREWYEVREQLQQSHDNDFLTVGSMGHTSSIALGMAMQSNAHILCVDGDGSMLMHMGSLAVAGSVHLENFHYVLINNLSHESVGGLPTNIHHIHFEQFFLSIGFDAYFRADTPENLENVVHNFINTKHAVLEIRVKQGSRKDLSRPDKTSGQISQTLREQFTKTKE